MSFRKEQVLLVKQMRNIFNNIFGNLTFIPIKKKTKEMVHLQVLCMNVSKVEGTFE